MGQPWTNYFIIYMVVYKYTKTKMPFLKRKILKKFNTKKKKLKFIYRYLYFVY